MTAASPLFLARLERLLSARMMRLPLKALVHAFSHTAVPVVAVERLAALMPDRSVFAEHHEHVFAARCPAMVDAAVPTHGALAGESVVVKDSIDVAGLPTTLGLARPHGDIARDDALIVRRVRDAGGVVLGKTKMTILGLDGLGAHVQGPMPANPRAPGYFPGGSSTGTAVAVAAGVARYGIGGDGMGSVRIPAGFCGLVGLKPTHDRLPVDGYPSVAPSMDVPGPIARDVDDCARLWSVLAADASAQSVGPWLPERFGVIRTLGPELACRSVARAFDDTLRRTGCAIQRVDIPLALQSAGIGMMTASDEVATGPYARLGVDSVDSVDIGAAGKLAMTLAQSLSHRGRARVRRLRERLKDETQRALDACGGFIALPTTAVPAPAVSRVLLDGGTDTVLLRAVGLYTPLANVTGLPAIAVPMGVDDRGRPLSIMIMGRAHSETDLLRIAKAIEAL
jgi:aspartyl-tRNA(Asn)/glutamyl-tRNA(Gln) amidotransferase subunit A